MKTIQCDICGAEMKDDTYMDIEFASLFGRDIRLFFDGDICQKCIDLAFKLTYKVLNDNLSDNIAPVGKWYKEIKE